jgi:23S rRNA pseudouridine955/2504/2580 synthase
MSASNFAAAFASCAPIDAANAGRRLDAYLRQLCAEVPLSALMRLLRRGAVRLNGQAAAGSDRLKQGDRLELPARLQSPGPVPPVRRRPLRLPRLHEDADILVLNKPAGIACHPGTAQVQASIIEQVQAYLGQSSVGHRPGLVQRLDAAVSGVLLIGKHAAALRILAEDVQSGSCNKTYLAWVKGRVHSDQGKVDVPLRQDDQPRGNLPRAVPDPENGQPCRTDYKVLGRGPELSLLEITLQTGRTHQIRAHMRYLGHPLLGDPRYGDHLLNEHLRETYGLRQVALHASSLQLVHPIEGRACVFSAPVPPSMQRLVPR